MRSTTIKICESNYSIGIVSDDIFDTALAAKGVADPDIKSFVDYDDQAVLVRERFSVSRQRELIMHELLHCCLEESGVFEQEVFEQCISIIAKHLVTIAGSKVETVFKDLDLTN